MRRWIMLFLAVSFWIIAPRARAADKPELWLYYPTNFAVPENVDKAEVIWKRAAAAGYTHVLIADSKFNRLGNLWPEYFKNCQRAKRIAADLHLQLVPALFSVGYSNDLLNHDPNLAEGVPVKDQPFVVKNGVAELVADPSLKLARVGFHDESVTIADGVATVKPGTPTSRFVFPLHVHPFRAYHVSVKIRTKDFSPQPQIAALAEGQALQYQNIHVDRAQDWKQYDVVFDSLDHTDVGVYFGIWDQVHGELQWKDWSIEEVGLLNVLRRGGAPCIVKNEDTGKTLVEGTDYEPIGDPHMGNIPYDGEYESYHTPPVMKTHLPDGTHLRVSWYYPPIVYDGQVAACISEAKTMELLADQARRMKELWGAPLYMMSHDEFRVFNWDESCQSRRQTPGEMLAENLRQCTQLLKPARAAVWNDMFDPYHNAVKGPYYLVNGPWLQSWQGLDKDVLVVNWNHGKRDESLKFFADRGNSQLIAGYYDNDLSELTQWKESASRVPNVIGYMYTTWRGDYSMLEKFAEMVKH